MKKKNKWLDSTKNKVIAAAISVVLVLSFIIGIYTLTQAKIDIPVIKFKENLVIEYGNTTSLTETTKETLDAIKDGTAQSDTALLTGVHITQIVDFKDSNLRGHETASIRIESELVTDTVSYIFTDKQKEDNPAKNTVAFGEKKIDVYKWIWDNRGDAKPFKGTIVITLEDGSEIKESFEYLVIDTVAPIISGDKNFNAEYNSPIDFSGKFKATDPVDGDVEVRVEGDIDYSKAGTYELIATSVDKHNNKTEMKFQVTVNEES